ncbi:uncharacterized protein LOC143550669 [Bidens hawaiensis]|uniref:uncharacterized protein LOC143550669 n=1 Tax=Bidens hawaiensis TaxID=980011 RepID=UPI00404A800A
MEDDQRELKLLPTPQFTRGPYTTARASPWPSDSIRYRSDDIEFPLESACPGPSLDLQLSISLRPIQPQTDQSCREGKGQNGQIEVLKWQTADQIRIATMEKAYAERVREMMKREMELAQSEFSCARHMWERAREEVREWRRLRRERLVGLIRIVSRLRVKPVVKNFDTSQ